MKVRRFRALSLFIVAAIVGLVPLAGPALAAPATVVTDLNPDTGLPPGQTSSLSFSISPDSRTLTSFTLTPPAGYQVVAVDPVAVGSAELTAGGAIRVTGLSTSPSQTTTVTFSATTSCVNGTHAWSVLATDSQNRSYNITGDRSSDVSGNCDLEVVNQPNNTKAGDLITSGDRQAGNFVTVQLVNDAGDPVDHFPVNVTFVLGSDPAGGTLSVTSELTNGDGLATFDTELEIDTANVAAFSDYTIVPRGATLTGITGPPSAGFDIWDDASRCGVGNCQLSHNGDEYSVPNGQAGALLSASTFDVSESNIDCTVFGYEEITNDVVWHEYTGDGPVLVKIHITRQEMKASANNGQRLVGLCVGLVDDVGGLTGQQKWASLGVTADHQDSDGDGTDDIWVALAPNCPNQLPQQYAPCIARQYGDGNGGSWTEAWLTGGDPPRRT